MRTKIIFTFLLTAAFAITSCNDQSTELSKNQQDKKSVSLRADFNLPSFDLKNSKASSGAVYSPVLAAVSNQLNLPGIALEKAEYMGDGREGLVIFANDKTLNLGSRWVPNDVRRGGDDDINYLVFQPLSTANGTINSEPSIDASFNTWNNISSCNNVELVKNADNGVFPSAILTLGGQPGDPSVSDINTVGFLPGVIFDAVLGAGASEFVLGVTFTFVYIDEDGNALDTNGDGKSDTAFKEIWYNDNFLWTDELGQPGVDIETVALHENGHALEKGHIGIGVFNPHTNEVRFTPRAVLNAAYFGALRVPQAMDHRSHCGTFGKWPIR